MPNKTQPMIAALAAIALSTLAVSTTAQAQMPAAHATDPKTVLQDYLDAVNSNDFDALTNLLSDDIASYTYRDCTPQMTPKQCLATFVDHTILKRHGSLVSPSAEVKGDQIIAVIEVRHDGTRAAHIPRMIGVDTITVKNGKIVSFAFKQYPDDASNKKLEAYYLAHPQERRT